jgi:hypothetical protein
LLLGWCLGAMVVDADGRESCQCGKLSRDLLTLPLMPGCCCCHGVLSHTGHDAWVFTVVESPCTILALAAWSVGLHDYFSQTISTELKVLRFAWARSLYVAHGVTLE